MSLQTQLAGEITNRPQAVLGDRAAITADKVERLLRRLPRRARRGPLYRAAQDYGLYRSVGLRQEHRASLL